MPDYSKISKIKTIHREGREGREERQELNRVQTRKKDFVVWFPSRIS
jgi:hypothetical protein